jgi:hypothetical protein
VEWCEDFWWRTPLGALVGNDTFLHVETVGFVGPRITDTSLENLNGLSQVHVLKLYAPNITDKGLENIKGLSQLEEVTLEKTKVTDAGLEHLKGLNNLRDLDLKNTKVTDEGVKKLQQALPNCKIEWDPPTKDERQSPAAPDQLR